MQPPHQVARPGALGAVAPLRLEGQLAPPRLDLGPQARLVGALGVLERGMDDRAETRGRAARIAAEVADDPVELALLERVQPRRRHPHVLAREVAQRPGRGRRARRRTTRSGAAPGDTGVGEHGELPRGARRAPRRAGAGERAPMLRDEPAQRQRMLDRRAARASGRSSKKTLGPVSSSSTAVTTTSAPRAAERAREQPQLVVHRGPAPVEGAG